MIGPLVFACLVASVATIVALLNGSTLLGAFFVYAGTGALALLCVALLMYFLPRICKSMGLQKD